VKGGTGWKPGGVGFIAIEEWHSMLVDKKIMKNTLLPFTTTALRIPFAG
jgi:hypothetical protein